MRAPATERPLTAGPVDGPEDPFPLHLSGPVIKGFGRGSKELQIPTANIPIDGLRVGGCETVESGVYYGYAGLDLPTTTTASDDDERGGSKVFPMVMSIGWNPFYKNSVRSVEVHIIHTFPKDFYGVRMNLVVLGFIRPEFDYVSKEALIEDIKMDVRVGVSSLEREGYRKFRNDPYLTNFEC
ncbi:riboflavin kinase [Choiromyces venosus 120613-1]|uniref:Riboflavin kinase n=1 Tax=Choiromyces venosus 120613-1 TaxID=1336337 RepID=A0A3N4IVR6_9PEZI|nr:riboflavin kinase [Choiromyces venosus 120613-1]